MRLMTNAARNEIWAIRMTIKSKAWKDLLNGRVEQMIGDVWYCSKIGSFNWDLLDEGRIY